MDVLQFDYVLPEDLIAEYPVDRGSEKMLVVDKERNIFIDKMFSDLESFIDNNTTVVFNSSKVIPARLYLKRKTGGNVEVLLIRNLRDYRWEAMVKSSKRLKDGEWLILSGKEVVQVVEKRDTVYEIEFMDNIKDQHKFIEKIGDMPLPPYILKKRNMKTSEELDKIKYQTVYADMPGSVAAPTAGLHFNKDMLEKINNITEGRVEYVSLHVGPGTFAPVKNRNITEHKMHKEYYEISDETANRLNDDKKNGRKIIAIGTTTVRTLESACDEKGFLQSGSNHSELFIYPGYVFKFVDQILTNFHLPKSTLLMMISAFAGNELVMNAYTHAVENRYRFYSYGDCMLLF